VRTRQLVVALFLSAVSLSSAQNSNSGDERTFPLPVSTIQVALKKFPGGTSGSLPLLDGFVIPGTRSLEGYKRPYYQCTVRITPAPSGGSLVRVTAKVTAWNSDPAHSGYEVLPSNGRLESDLLDRLQDFLASNSAGKISASDRATTVAKTANPPARKAAPAPDISAPMPQFPNAAGSKTPASTYGPQSPALEQEVKSLEELLRNQSHPTNLIAVKQDRAPVLQDARADSKVLFLASAEDEFEVLDVNPEWVHIRISGLSRGWLRRSAVEMLDGSETVADRAPASVDAPHEQAADAPSAASRLFSITGEEEGSFPGEWAPLKGKSVKIISIQQAPGTGRITSPRDKMQFAENLFRSEASTKSAAGLVLIFDAEDGGMIAATRASLDQWKNGALSEQAFWKQCYLDPPEILGSAN
jgi:hypothetical protein